MTAKETKANEITLSRFYEAPVSAVWDAWTDPNQAAQWWGPRGFTITTHSKDLKPGGHWHYTMHGPNGADYENKSNYFEVEKEKKLVYDHGGLNERKPLFRVTVIFAAIKGGTKMDMTMACPSDADAQQTRQFIKKAGGEATWDRLTEYLEEKSSGKKTFVINRSFDAPIGVMFEMWSDPKHFSKWLAPTGFSMKFIKEDVRPGGTSFYSMTADNGGMTMHGKVSYIQMRKPDWLLYTQWFTDDKGNTSRHPLAPTWPETMQTAVRFAEEGSNRTRVTVTWEVVGKATSEEMDTFIKGRTGMTQGWTGSFDKLEKYLLTGMSAGA